MTRPKRATIPEKLSSSPPPCTAPIDPASCSASGSTPPVSGHSAQEPPPSRKPRKRYPSDHKRTGRGQGWARGLALGRPVNGLQKGSSKLSDELALQALTKARGIRTAAARLVPCSTQ